MKIDVEALKRLNNAFIVDGKCLGRNDVVVQETLEKILIVSHMKLFNLGFHL